MLKRELGTIKGQHDFRNFINDNKNPPCNTVLTISCIELSILHQLHPNYPTSPSIDQPCSNPDAKPAYIATNAQPALRTYAEAPYILRIRIVGSGFLRHMVRRIVGTLHWIACGKLKEGAFTRVLQDGADADVNSAIAREKEDNKKEEEKVSTKEEAKVEGTEDVEEQEKTKQKEHIQASVEIKTDGDETLTKATNSTNSTIDPIKETERENAEVEKGIEGGNGETKGNSKKREALPKKQRNKHRLNKVPKRERKEFLGPAAAAKGLWMEKVWYGDDKQKWCLDPEVLNFDFSPFVDCSFTTVV